MPMLKQISEIDENVLPDYYNEPLFLKWLEENLAEKEEFNKRNYDGIYINKKLDNKDNNDILVIK